MKTPIFALAIAIAGLWFAGIPANAEVTYRWCALYGGHNAGIDCGFVTQSQCRATISGLGGICYENPAAAGAPPVRVASAGERALDLWHLGLDDQYPWCALYSGRGGGATNCGFSTFAQCRATISGVGGRCYENPAYQEIGQYRPHRRVARRKAHRAHHAR